MNLSYGVTESDDVAFRGACGSHWIYWNLALCIAVLSSVLLFLGAARFAEQLNEYCCPKLRFPRVRFPRVPRSMTSSFSVQRSQNAYNSLTARLIFIKCCVIYRESLEHITKKKKPKRCDMFQEC